jgi:hypothetical protein
LSRLGWGKPGEKYFAAKEGPEKAFGVWVRGAIFDVIVFMKP